MDVTPVEEAYVANPEWKELCRAIDTVSKSGFVINIPDDFGFYAEQTDNASAKTPNRNEPSAHYA